MSEKYNKPDSLGAFYAHALGLEYECEHRLIDLGRTLEAHHNPDAASIFERAEKMRADNIQKINQRCEKLDLPRVAPWDYYWHQYVNIESICIDSVHYLISAAEAIDLVMAKLGAAVDFYRESGVESELPEIQQAAQEIIDLLEQEMQTAEGWKSQYEVITALPDLDPPNQPE